MEKTYKVIVVDDEPRTIDPVLQLAKRRIQKYGYAATFVVLSKKNQVKELNTMVADVVMFDCAMSAGDFDFKDEQEARYGLSILKEYRELNKRTKIIFYSGAYNFEDDQSIKLTKQDFINMINELNVFAIVNHEADMMAEYLIKAFDQMEPVLAGMEDLMQEYADQGIFTIDGVNYSSEELLKELKLGTKAGDSFRKNINEIIISYLMKFKG